MLTRPFEMNGRPWHASAVVLPMALALAGCMTGPDYARPDVLMPDSWSSAREGGAVDGPAPATAWWTTLDDPILNDLIDQAAENNFDINIAEARVREARAARGIAASALWPTLNAGASGTRRQGVEVGGGGGPSISGGISKGGFLGTSRNFTIRNGDFAFSHSQTSAGNTNGLTFSPGSSGGAPDRTTNLFQAGFDAMWELDVFGGNRRAIEAADADIEAANEFRRDVLVSLLSEVAINYVDLRTAQNRLKITESNIKAQSETVNLTTDRFKAGLSSELDALQSKALLASTQSQVPLLQTQIARSIHRLSVLLGDAPGTMKEALSPPADLPGAVTNIPVGLPSDLLRRRADIRQSERALAAATARIGVAVSDLYPKFSLTGSLGGQGSILGHILDSGNQTWSLGPGISWPIFQGGRIRANIEVQNARQEQALLAYQKTIMTAFEDVENSLVAYAQEQVRQKALESAVEANVAAVRLANERYIRGLEGFLNVLQAQQELFRTQDQLVQSHSLVLTDLISLYKALGGGWELFEPGDSPEPAIEAAIVEASTETTETLSPAP